MAQLEDIEQRETLEIADLDAADWNDFGIEQGWSDGMPLIPPTEEAVAKFLLATQMAQHRITYGSRFGREIGLIHRALQQSSRRHQQVLGVDRLCRHHYRRRTHQDSDESSHGLPPDCVV